MLQTESNDILTSIRDGVRIIKFNRPNKKNAINRDIYLKITEILDSDATNDHVVVTVFTGIGEYYSSGNDLQAEDIFSSSDMQKEIDNRCKVVEDFVAAFIRYPKLLVSIVNGPAIGIAVTTLALVDIVYASNRATFYTPFTKLGFCPEGCSSYLFPRIMGKSRAMEVLILGRKLTAYEALNCNLVSEVVEHAELENLFVKIQELGKLPVNTVKRSKQLMNAYLQEKLHQVNKEETSMLQLCLSSTEAIDAIMKFMSKKHKL